MTDQTERDALLALHHEGCTCPRIHPHMVDLITAAGFTRQSRAEIQAGALEAAIKYAATDEHVGMTRDEAIGYEAALELFRDYAQRIREGGGHD